MLPQKKREREGYIVQSIPAKILEAELK